MSDNGVKYRCYMRSRGNILSAVCTVNRPSTNAGIHHTPCPHTAHILAQWMGYKRDNIPVQVFMLTGKTINVPID